MKVVLAALLLATALPVCGQSLPSNHLVSEAMSDAEYAVRRFDEVTSRVNFNLWRVPEETLSNSRRALADVKVADVKSVKSVLAHYDGSKSPSSVELLDLMSGLTDMGAELANLSDGEFNFREPDDVAKAAEVSQLGLDLQQASSNSFLAAARLYGVLRPRILFEEGLLRACNRTIKDDQKAMKEMKQ